jgi:hypothetical protein
MENARCSWFVILIAAGILVAYHLYWIPLLPERLASHFDGAGLANGWMSRFNLYALSFDFAGNSRFHCRTAFLDEATG